VVECRSWRSGGESLRSDEVGGGVVSIWSSSFVYGVVVELCSRSHGKLLCPVVASQNGAESISSV
jgi:hypothetical protein